jgi:cephalosporin hydroxylase
MQTYEQRLTIARDLFGLEFGIRKEGRLLFGHTKTEFATTNTQLEQLCKQPLANLVELGVNWGASLFMFSRFLAPKSVIVGVDCGLYPGIHDVHKVLDYLRDKEGHTVHFLNITTAAAIPEVKKLVPSIAMLHIDAGHEYADAKHDWTNYTPMVAAGGLILMHDIAFGATPGVSKFWQEIRKKLPKKYEIVAPKKPGERRNGMAIVIKTW